MDAAPTLKKADRHSTTGEGKVKRSGGAASSFGPGATGALLLGVAAQMGVGAAQETGDNVVTQKTKQPKHDLAAPPAADTPSSGMETFETSEVIGAAKVRQLAQIPAASKKQAQTTELEHIGADEEQSAARLTSDWKSRPGVAAKIAEIKKAVEIKEEDLKVDFWVMGNGNRIMTDDDIKDLVNTDGLAK